MWNDIKVFYVLVPSGESLIIIQSGKVTLEDVMYHGH